MWKRQDDLVARPTIRGYLVLLTLAILLPVLIFSAILYFSYYRAEQSRIEADLEGDARQLALTVERDLAALQYTAQTLATAVRIADRDYATSAAPVSPAPVTAANTSGAPISFQPSSARTNESGVTSLGLTSTAAPAHSAGVTSMNGPAIGKSWRRSGRTFPA